MYKPPYSSYTIICSVSTNSTSYYNDAVDLMMIDGANKMGIDYRLLVS